MADNITLNSGSGGSDIATDQASGGEHYQYVKVAFGPDNTQTKVSSSDPLPITTTALPLPSGAATAAKQDTEIASLASIDTQSSSAASSLSAIEAALATTSGVGSGSPLWGLQIIGTDGTNARALKTDTSGELQVDVLTLPGVAGTVATGFADTGNPVKIGGRADTTFVTAVDDGDRVDAIFDVYGVQYTRGDHPNKWSYHENSSNALTDAAVQGAPVGGFSIYITDIIFSNGSSSSLSVFIEEVSTTILGPYYLEAVAGRSIHLRFSTPKKCTAATAITATTSAAVAHSLDILGFIAP